MTDEIVCPICTGTVLYLSKITGEVENCPLCITHVEKYLREKERHREADSNGNIERLYENCPVCRGRGYVLEFFIKRDGTESKRRRRDICLRCAGRGSIIPENLPSYLPNDDIPF